MRRRYRIKQYENSHTKRLSYEIQRKSWIGFWYNARVGYCGNLESAKEKIKRLLSKENIKIVYETEG